jgi:hypothetical protein
MALQVKNEKSPDKSGLFVARGRIELPTSGL